MKADAVWKSSSGARALAILGADTKQDDISPALISSDAKACKGKFASGSMPDDKNAQSGAGAPMGADHVRLFEGIHPHSGRGRGAAGDNAVLDGLSATISET